MTAAPANAPVIAQPFNPWPWALIGFFVMLITGIVAFVIFALHQDLELVGADYYEQELRYQKQIDRVQRTRPFAGQVAVNYGDGRIVLSLPTAHARLAPTGTLRLYRPSDARLDQDVPLAPDAAGRQEIDARALRSGLWKVRVTWQAGSEEFYRDETVLIP